MTSFLLRVRTGLAVLAAAVLLTAGVSAHHGWAGYQDAQFELTGTLDTDINLGGPHATARIKAADGQVWDLTLAPGARTQRTGLKEGVIPVGAKVTASGHRHRDPKRFEIKTEKLTWNGKVFNVYPDRES